MNVKLKIKLTKWAIIVLAWLCVAIWQTFYDHFTVLSDISRGFTNTYDFPTQLIFNSTAGVVGAIMGGAFLIFFIEEKFREKAYGRTLLVVAMSFVFIVSFITFFLGFLFVPIISGHPLSSDQGWQAFQDFIRDPVHVKNILLWATIVCLTQFFIQVNNKFGQGILFNFIKGTYRSPKKEERIFMFVDLKSSTSIAEELGNEKYHDLLKDFFRDITNPIIYNLGQIYQYVGDEVVISWPLQNGLHNHHCIRCYLDMQKTIKQNENNYLDKYALVPEFKVGIHYGTVTAGEIGIIKRDLTFSGDVLNTAARIQSKCNELGVNFLASKQLTDLLHPTEEFISKSLGFISLRGKEKDIELCTII